MWTKAEIILFHM